MLDGRPGGPVEVQECVSSGHRFATPLSVKNTLLLESIIGAMLERAPDVHLGPVASEMERRGKRSKRGSESLVGQVQCCRGIHSDRHARHQGIAQAT